MRDYEKVALICFILCVVSMILTFYIGVKNNGIMPPLSEFYQIWRR